MTKLIAILRGINVGGKRKILMSDLGDLFESMGFKNVVTYIQSGNVIFDKSGNLSTLKISNQIEKAIKEKFGFDVPVILISSRAISDAVTSNPYYKEKGVDTNQLHLTFLKELPSDENRILTESYNYEPDKFIIDGQNVFILCRGKYHKSKLTNSFFEKRLETTATTRNWKTVLKLLELSSK